MNLLKPSCKLIVALVWALASYALHAGDYYKWVGDDGITHYGSTPPKGVKAVRVTTYGDKGTSKRAQNPSFSSETDTLDEGAEANAAPSDKQKQLQDARKQECDQEKQRLATLKNSGTRIRMSESDGSSRYLKPDEILKEIKLSEEFLRDACSQ